jgi:hypothetical protein
MDRRRTFRSLTTRLIVAVIIGCIVGPGSGLAGAGGSTTSLEQLGKPVESSKCASVHYSRSPPATLKIGTRTFHNGFRLSVSQASGSCGQYYGRFKWHVGTSHTCWTAWIGPDKSDPKSSGFQFLNPTGHQAVLFNAGPNGASCTAKPNTFAISLSPGELEFVALPGLKSSKTVFIWIAGQSGKVKVDFGNDQLH